MNWRKIGDGFEYASPIQYNQEYRQVEMEKKAHESENDESENLQWEEGSESGGKKKRITQKKINHSIRSNKR